MKYEKGEEVFYRTEDIAFRGVVWEFYDHHEWAHVMTPHLEGVWIRSRLLQSEPQPELSAAQRGLERIRKGEEAWRNSRRSEKERG